jgi:hypothetical protein
MLPFVAVVMVSEPRDQPIICVAHAAARVAE